MVRKKVKDPKVDTELVYAHAKAKDLGPLEEFITGTHLANLQAVGDRCGGGWGPGQAGGGGQQSAAAESSAAAAGPPAVAPHAPCCHALTHPPPSAPPGRTPAKVL